MPRFACRFPNTLLLFLLWSVQPCLAVNIETVVVGDPGNPIDTERNFGAVDYSFRIGKYEVTNSEYVEFLNTVASSDPYALFDPQMASSIHGGIVRNGSAGSFSYSVKPGMNNKPVTFVSWYDSARFANWLHNGQGSGDTEDGAYTILGGTPIPSNAREIFRNEGARWFIPRETEWYKAAYYNPESATYYSYPTSSNTAPIAEPPVGGVNSANYSNAVGTVTDVGAYALSQSVYGTFDQGGNVWEWNESRYFATDRGVRGGSWHPQDEPPQVTKIGYTINGSMENSITGLRLATIIPEPSTLILASVALLPLSCCRQRRYGA